MTQPNITPKKTYPIFCTKRDLVKMYRDQMTEADILRNINEIIRENRKIPKEKPVCVKRIWTRELIEFAHTYGVARGYEMPQAA